MAGFVDKDVTFEGGPFKTYENDVLTRHKNEFEACLLYLKDFMEAIDLSDMEMIQALRTHRNDLAHNLPDRLTLDKSQATQNFFSAESPVSGTLRLQKDKL